MQGLSPEEYQNLILSVGTHRSSRPYSPMEVAQSFEKAIDSGATKEDCAKAVLLDGTSTVDSFLNLLKLDSKVQYLVGWGRSDVTISFSTASLLSPLNIDDQCKVSTAILAHKFTEKEIRQLRQLHKRSERPIEECINETLQMRPQIQIFHVFVGVVTSEQLSSLLSEMTQSQRDDLLQSILLEQFPQKDRLSCRLGIDRFTLVGGDDFDITEVTKIHEDFEEAINDELLKRLV